MTEVPSEYYDQERPDVVAVIPEHVCDVLDIGCATGGLGRALKRLRPGIRVRGVEIAADQAARAREVLDGVFTGSFEAALPEDWPRPDCIVFADVLEHLLDPWAAVARARQLLVPGGVLVASIPNIAHASVISGLLRGRWDYQPSGLLDQTHLRFFTRATALALIESGGFRIDQVTRNFDWERSELDRKFHGALRRAAPVSRERGRFGARLVSSLADAVTLQFVIVATAKTDGA